MSKRKPRLAKGAKVQRKVTTWARDIHEYFIVEKVDNHGLAMCWCERVNPPPGFASLKKLLWASDLVLVSAASKAA